MKTIKYIIIFAAIAISSVVNATVRTLNNNNPSPGQYTTWSAVHAASAINDTIYVSGSIKSYGNISVTVSNLTIIGTGHNPQKQNPLVSKFGKIICNAGQIRIDGILCDTLDITPSFGTAQLYLSNSYVTKGLTATVSGSFDCYLYLKNNIIDAESYPAYGFPIYLNLSTGSLKGEIRNNAIYGSIYVSKIDGCDITNNIFNHSYYNYLFFTNSQYNNSLFSNNSILGYPDHGIPSNSNVICQNNLVSPSPFSQALPNNSGTINTTNPLFVNYSSNGFDDFSYSINFQLQSSSVGHNAGTDGTDVGPYGGIYGATFTTYGEPPIPQIKQMNMPTTVVSGNNFSVNIISTVK